MSPEAAGLHRLFLSTLREPRRGKSNPRFACACGHKTTKRQARKNGGLCSHCKRPLEGFK